MGMVRCMKTTSKLPIPEGDIEEADFWIKQHLNK